MATQLGRLAVSRLLLARSATPKTAGGTIATARAMSQSWQQYGVPGSTFPFKITNRYRLTLYFALYFGTAFNLPFIVVAHQLMKH